MDEDKKSDDDLVPTKELAQMVLSYAKEMEKIVWKNFHLKIITFVFFTVLSRIFKLSY